MIIKNLNHIKRLNFLQTSDCCIELEGTNDYIDISSNIDISNVQWNQPFSFFCWVRKPVIPPALPLLGNYRGNPNAKGWFFQMLGTIPQNPTFTQTVRFQFRTTGTGAAGTVMDIYSQQKYDNSRLWNFVGVTSTGAGNSAGMQIYVNDIQSPQPHTFTQGTFINTGSIISGEPVVVGALIQNVGAYGQGCLKHLSFFNDVVSPSDALSMYNKGMNSPNYSDIPNLVSHYTFRNYDLQDRISGTFGVPSGMTENNIKCS